MDCVITAGGRPTPEDPLYLYTQGQPKALLDMGGRTMLERVVDALQSSQSIEEIVVAGLGHDHGQSFRRPVHHLPDQGSLVANALAGVAWVRQRRPDAEAIFLSSADVPTITGEIIDAHVDACRPFDCAVYYAFVTQEIMEARFPGSRRTFVPLKNRLRVAGGDIFLIQPSLADHNPALWEAMTNARKHAWRLASIVGPGTLLKFLFRRLSVPDLEATGARMINRPVKIILSPHAELAMDADKPHQVDLLRAEFNM